MGRWGRAGRRDRHREARDTSAEPARLPGAHERSPARAVTRLLLEDLAPFGTHAGCEVTARRALDFLSALRSVSCEAVNIRVATDFAAIHSSSAVAVGPRAVRLAGEAGREPALMFAPFSKFVVPDGSNWVFQGLKVVVASAHWIQQAAAPSPVRSITPSQLHFQDSSLSSVLCDGEGHDAFIGGVATFFSVSDWRTLQDSEEAYVKDSSWVDASVLSSPGPSDDSGVSFRLTNSTLSCARQDTYLLALQRTVADVHSVGAMQPTGCFFSEDNGMSYRGAVQHTTSQQPCLAWDSRRSVRQYVNSSTFPGGGLEGARCRNADGRFSRPYCHIDTAPYVELCDIPECAHPRLLSAATEGWAPPPPPSDVPVAASQLTPSNYTVLLIVLTTVATMLIVLLLYHAVASLVRLWRGGVLAWPFGARAAGVGAAGAVGRGSSGPLRERAAPVGRASRVSGLAPTSRSSRLQSASGPLRDGSPLLDSGGGGSQGLSNGRLDGEGGPGGGPVKSARAGDVRHRAQSPRKSGRRSGQPLMGDGGDDSDIATVDSILQLENRGERDERGNEALHNASTAEALAAAVAAAGGELGESVSPNDHLHPHAHMWLGSPAMRGHAHSALFDHKRRMHQAMIQQTEVEAAHLRAAYLRDVHGWLGPPPYSVPAFESGPLYHTHTQTATAGSTFTQTQGVSQGGSTFTQTQGVSQGVSQGVQSVGDGEKGSTSITQGVEEWYTPCHTPSHSVAAGRSPHAGVDMSPSYAGSAASLMSMEFDRRGYMSQMAGSASTRYDSPSGQVGGPMTWPRRHAEAEWTGEVGMSPTKRLTPHHRRRQHSLGSPAFAGGTMEFMETGGGAYRSLSSKSETFQSDSLASQHPVNLMDHDIKIGKMLGKGSFAQVFQGLWNDTAVAIKVIEHNASARDAVNPILEATLSKELSHPNVVTTYDFGWSGSDAAFPSVAPDCSAMVILMEYCNLKSLASNIRSSNRFGHMQGSLKWTAIAYALVDVLRGLKYLHDMDVIHGDLKAANVMLKSTHKSLSSVKFTAKVADLGLAQLRSYTNDGEPTVGSLTHAAPELLQRGPNTPQSDIYAFGVLMYELISGKEPYKGCSPSDVIMKKTSASTTSSLKLDASEDSTYKAFAEVYADCVGRDPAHRPNTSDLFQRVRTIATSMGLFPKESVTHYKKLKVWPDTWNSGSPIRRNDFGRSPSASNVDVCMRSPDSTMHDPVMHHFSPRSMNAEAVARMHGVQGRVGLSPRWSQVYSGPVPHGQQTMPNSMESTIKAASGEVVSPYAAELQAEEEEMRLLRVPPGSQVGAPRRSFMGASPVRYPGESEHFAAHPGAGLKPWERLMPPPGHLEGMNGMYMEGGVPMGVAGKAAVGLHEARNGPVTTAAVEGKWLAAGAYFDMPGIAQSSPTWPMRHGPGGHASMGSMGDSIPGGVFSDLPGSGTYPDSLYVHGRRMSMGSDVAAAAAVTPPRAPGTPDGTDVTRGESGIMGPPTEAFTHESAMDTCCAESSASVTGGGGDDSSSSDDSQSQHNPTGRGGTMDAMMEQDMMLGGDSAELKTRKRSAGGAPSLSSVDSFTLDLGNSSNLQRILNKEGGEGGGEARHRVSTIPETTTAAADGEAAAQTREATAQAAAAEAARGAPRQTPLRRPSRGQGSPPLPSTASSFSGVSGPGSGCGGGPGLREAVAVAAAREREEAFGAHPMNSEELSTWMNTFSLNTIGGGGNSATLNLWGSQHNSVLTTVDTRGMEVNALEAGCGGHHGIRQTHVNPLSMEEESSMGSFLNVAEVVRGVNGIGDGHASRGHLRASPDTSPGPSPGRSPGRTAEGTSSIDESAHLCSPGALSGGFTGPVVEGRAAHSPDSHGYAHARAGRGVPLSPLPERQGDASTERIDVFVEGSGSCSSEGGVVRPQLPT